MVSQTDVASLSSIPQVAGLQVIVKQETPFLPKVAFTLISIASLAGVTVTGTLAGSTPLDIGLKWFALWILALAGGFAVWRAIYLRASDAEAAQEKVTALNQTAFTRARLVGRWVAVGAVIATLSPFVVGYLEFVPGLRLTLGALMLALAALLAIGVDRMPVAIATIAVVLSSLLIWSYIDAGPGWQGWVRIVHLAAFTLWIGGALWNIAVAMPAGREHANVDAVIAGAHQLDRFRWVVRFSLPSIIITGLIMAGAFRAMPMEWWLAFPGILIPVKVLAIVALVVVFITCPLFRHCSPVQGVCNIDDLGDAAKVSAVKGLKVTEAPTPESVLSGKP